MKLSVNARDFPIWLMFCIFPFISIFAWLSSKGEVNYDYVWGPALPLLIGYCIFFMRKRFFRKSYIIFFLILSFFIIIKYVVPWNSMQISLVASVMDGKWVVYLAFALLWIDTFGYPDVNKIYKYCLFFSIIYILKALYMILSGHLTREGLLLEANYDGFMILIVYCFRSIPSNNQKWWKDAIFILATLLTFSRTGYACLFAMLIYKALKRNILYLLIILPFAFIAIYFGYSIRGGQSANNLDRFVYWSQALVYFKQTNWTTLFFGSAPGKSLEMPILPEFYWTVENFDEIRNLNGIFPFMFHSTYLRLAFTWGIFIAFVYLIYLIIKILKSKYRPMVYLCILVLIQSFSLSALTLPNVSLLLFMLFLTALHQEKCLKKTQYYPNKNLVRYSRTL